MKILQLLAGAPHGGAETAFVDMCIALREAGEEIIVATRPNDLRVGQMKKAGIKVYELPFGGAVDFYTGWQLKKIIKAHKPDIVQSWMARASDKVPKIQRNAAGRPVTLARLGGYYSIKYFRNIDYFVAITPDLKRHIKECGIDETRITHINNFAETETPEIPVNRADLNTPEDAKVLITLSRLHKNKAIDTLLKALVDLPGVYAWLAGEGPLKEELQDLAAQLGVSERVRFLGWRDDRAALLQAADICVFPSRWEPFGTVFVQAWSQQIPLVTTASDGPRQFVRDEEDALMTEIDNVDALTKAIQRIIDDPDLARKLVQNGLRRYQNEFTKEKTVSRYLDYYRDIRKREGLEG